MYIVVPPLDLLDVRPGPRELRTRHGGDDGAQPVLLH